MNRMLIAFDGSEDAMRAVEYAGRYFSALNGMRMTLLYVLPYVPAIFWDDGHILTADERAERKVLVENWLAGQRAWIKPALDKATGALVESGIAPGQLETKMISDSTDVAGSIIEEARSGGYQTLVIGRRGISAAEHFLMGSVTNKVLNHGTGMAICIVE